MKNSTLGADFHSVLNLNRSFRWRISIVTHLVDNALQAGHNTEVWS